MFSGSRGAAEQGQGEEGLAENPTSPSLLLGSSACVWVVSSLTLFPLQNAPRPAESPTTQISCSSTYSTFQKWK